MSGDPPTPGTSNPLVSVIVPTRNDAVRLGELLSALEAQTLAQERFEVVIGDDGSDDECVQAKASPDERVRVLWGPPTNSYSARNRAVGAARGPVLAFCDSDCAPEPQWLEEGLRALERSDVVAGPIHFTAPERPTAWTLLTIDLYCDQERYVQRGRAAGGNLFMRRELFDSLGGFDASLPNGSDSDLVARAVERGATLDLATEAVVWHPTRDDARSFLSKMWAVSRRAGVRDGRVGRGPGVRSIGFWLPPVEMFLARRRQYGSVGLNRHRLGVSGVASRNSAGRAALALLYLVIPYVMRAGKIVGWLEGRGMRASHDDLRQGARLPTVAERTVEHASADLPYP